MDVAQVVRESFPTERLSKSGSLVEEQSYTACFAPERRFEFLGASNILERKGKGDRAF